MCGRFSLGDQTTPEELQAIMDAINRREGDEPVKTSGEVFPSDLVPVVAPDRSRRPGVFAMRWGYGMPDGRRIINARSETAGERALFMDGIARRRCAIPAVCYYEWDRRSPGRDKYAIAPREGLTWLAGLYRLGEAGPEFVVLTRPPASDIAFLHDRMPVLVPGDLVGDWIDPSRDAAPLLGKALNDVRFERQRPENEQLTMTF